MTSPTTGFFSAAKAAPPRDTRDIIDTAKDTAKTAAEAAAIVFLIVKTSLCFAKMIEKCMIEKSE
jgi:hypothetical protein